MTVFDQHAQEYDHWFDENEHIQAGFGDFEFVQTIIGQPGKTFDLDQVCEGYGKGAFVVLSARKF